MLNNVCIMGRITKDLEVKATPGGASVLSFSIAVERNYASANGERETDFIDCVAWRQQAEFIAKYFGKGRMIALTGELRKRAYEDKNGVKHYPTEVYVTSASFTGESKKDNPQGGNTYTQQSQQNNVQVQPSQGNTPQYAQQGMGNMPPQQPSQNISDFDDFDMSGGYDDGVPF